MITDPTGEVPSFLLSGEAPRKADGTLYTHYEAAGGVDPQGNHHEGYCNRMDETLMTEAQARALSRAIRPNGRYDRNAIAGLNGTFVWSSVVHPAYRGYAWGVVGLNGYVDYVYRYDDRSVRCARAVPAW